jgi:hypothetical protein
VYYRAFFENRHLTKLEITGPEAPICHEGMNQLGGKGNERFKFQI